MTDRLAKLQEKSDSLAGVVYLDPVEGVDFPWLGRTKANP